MNSELKRKMVVLDDDPTGIQTVHGCLLITEWTDDALHEAFRHEQPFFYILTNTRAMTRQQAEDITRDAMEAVVRVNKEYGCQLTVVSRSDSCLRGHFPLETDVISDVLRENGIELWPRQIFCPALIEAGRVTIGGVHYMKAADGTLTPVSETEFAHDNVFGYSTSVLRDYIREKGADPDKYEIIDAQNYDELYAFCERLRKETDGFGGAVVIRSSSSLPRALSGISSKPLLTRSALSIGDGVGCFVVGSHVKKTTLQLESLLKCEGTVGIELPIDRILHDQENMMQETLESMLTIANEHKTPVVFTARKEVRIDDPDERQRLGQTVSDFLVDIVRRLPYQPSYLVAKGGITSHDILTHGLSVRTATVMGQIISSVPCIMTTRFPYVIFPGNVGNEDSLSEIYNKLKA